MRTQSGCLALAIVLLCPFASAQWVHTSLPDSLSATCFAVNGTNLLAGTIGGGVFRSINNGTSWTAASNGLPTQKYIYALAVSSTNLFAGAAFAGVFLSTDNGTSWNEVNQGLPKYSFAPFNYLPIQCFAPSGQNLFAGTLGGGVFRSTNNGTDWTEINTGLPPHTFVSALAVSGTNLFAATEDSGVFLSTNNGTSWTAVNTGITNTHVSALAVSPNGAGGGNLFAGVPGSVLLSTNNGTSWTVTGLRSEHITSLAVSNTNLFAGTQNSRAADSVFLSTDGGASWKTVGIFLGGLYVLVVSDTNLFAGTAGGVWRRPLAEMITSVQATGTEMPCDFRLDQNYPNPFNPTTTIRYTIAGVVAPSGASLSGVEGRVNNVRLVVYDILGREVATLVNEVKEPGTYTVQFDGSNLASGVYFYRMTAGTFMMSQKMLLTK